MAAGEAAGDRWRDEDGTPSPEEEFGPGEWWRKYEPDEFEHSYPPDHAEYVQELYDEIAELRSRLARAA